MRVYEHQAAATRQKFIDAAFELFTDHGYGATSMNAIAKRAGGSRANLYLHFRNKPDIVLARMQELTPAWEKPFKKLFDETPTTHAATLTWLESMKALWLREKVQFSAIEQAMAEDDAVAKEWWAMVNNIANELPIPDRREHFITLWMGLDRTFQFVYGHGYNQDEENMLNTLADQWLTLFI